MDFEGIGKVGLMDAARLTGVVITLASRAVICAPIRAVIGLIPTAPTGGFIAFDVCRLPRAHALARAEIVFFGLCVLATKLLAAPIAVKNFATTTESDDFAGAATGWLLGFAHPEQAIGLDDKGLAADMAGQMRSVILAVLTLAGIRAKENARLVSAQVRHTVKGFLSAIRAGDCLARSFFSHTWDYTAHLFKSQYLVACEQTGRIGRGMEIEPKYVAVSLERLVGLGLTPQRIGNARNAGIVA